MRERVLAIAAACLGAYTAACGGAQHAQGTQEAQRFDCRNRIASYVVAHHMAGDEIGVQIDCAQVGPRIKRWRADSAGNREEDAHGLTPGEFENVWKEIDGTGWPNLHDCANGTGGKHDPIYLFDIKDDQNQASFQCQSQSMPYPYNDIVDPLDFAAQNGRRELGKGEPDELAAPAPSGDKAPAPSGGKAPAPRGGKAPAPRGGKTPASRGGKAPR